MKVPFKEFLTGTRYLLVFKTFLFSFVVTFNLAYLFLYA